MASKTNVTARAKAKTKYFAQGVEVSPVRIGRQMWWSSEDGKVRVKKWELKKVVGG